MAKQSHSTFRLSEEAKAAAHRLQQHWAYDNRTAAVESALTCWLATLEHAGEAVARRFTREEWSLIADVCNGTDWPYGPTLSSPGPLIAQEVADGCQRGMHYRWLSSEPDDVPALVMNADVKAQADGKARDLLRRLAALEYAEGWAVVQAVCWFWRQDGVGTDGTQEWWSPGWRREYVAKVASEE